MTPDLSQRLNHIMQSPIPLYRLREILIEQTSKDLRFMAYLRENGYDNIVTKNPNITKRAAWCSQDNTRFPWESEQGRLMIRLETIQAIKAAIASQTTGPA